MEDVSVEDNTLRVSFAPFALQGVNWDIDMVAAMEDGKHYMNTWLEISADDPSAAAINYIDLDHFVIPEDASDVWSIPDESQISSMWIGKHELMLGQPIYADGLFFGSEFPAQETDVEDDAMKIRYYSGKTIAKMAEDGQDVRNGNMFRTWNNVVGAAQGTETAVVQTDFFDYIEDIATPSTFRKQYNSWYDNMMNISDSSIEASFLGAEKGLAQNSDSGELEKFCLDAMAANPKAVEQFKGGNEKAINALIGPVMKASKGKANPAMVLDIMKKLISK